MGRAGVRVYIDRHGTGRWQPDDPTTYTGPHGTYAFGRLDPGTFAFRTALADGLVLAAAMSAATLKDPAFDLKSALRHIFAEGLPVAFCISPKEEIP